MLAPALDAFSSFASFVDTFSQNSVSNVVALTCDPNAVCSGAKCICSTNYYGNGLSCSRKARRSWLAATNVHLLQTIHHESTAPPRLARRPSLAPR